ncbi:MAG: FAD-dependent monooxygenase [Desulfamplus sp.]|nr:FAD-dependent monooxygenase [Desulfamplus sp.]
MGYHEISLKMPTDYKDYDLKEALQKELKKENLKIDSNIIKDAQFQFQILNKSLDARKKSDIHWLIKVGVNLEDKESNDNSSKDPTDSTLLNIEYKKRDKKALVVGSGPAGFFAAYVLQMSGFNTTIIERGSEVNRREESIKEFEATGKFNPITNYAFGEGGAGTFSDGKLTSRSKHISKERQFIVTSYVNAGAPKEILYMAHPHLGSDNLKEIVKNLRRDFINIGGTILFETMLRDLTIKNGKVVEVLVSSLENSSFYEINADEFVVATGHSAFETYKMLIKNGVKFRAKNFAIGSRVEHPQELINVAQWGVKSLAGVKAAEYRLTSKADGSLPVYTFCMCPGGVIVPSTAYEKSNIVNGMSRYMRDGNCANAACVAGVNPEMVILDSKEFIADKILDWLESFEQKFYNYSNGYAAPFCSIKSFINKKLEPKEFSKNISSSYPLGLKLAPLWELLPSQIAVAICEGLKDFSRKIRGFETGLIMGLESKTSAPVAAVRETNYCCTAFDNLYITGEGSGHSGGIISSASDGIRAALSIIAKHN